MTHFNEFCVGLTPIEVVRKIQYGTGFYEKDNFFLINEDGNFSSFADYEIDEAEG